MLKTKTIISTPLSTDGHRVSVMSRHTMSDGRTPNPEIRREHYEHHWPALGPDPKLIGDWYHRQLPWEVFTRRYMDGLRTNANAQERLRALLALLRDGSDITLLCVEKSPHNCHRRLLAEECRRLLPGLCVIIK